MSSPQIHWLDSNVYIQAKNGPYRFNVFRRFWAFLDEQLIAGTIRSPKMVYDEIVSNEEPHDASPFGSRIGVKMAFACLPAAACKCSTKR